jgi:hypothetical protein|tara:strand:+ start:810 stop:1034 length:225 start_codon:yes stop_codon:yes gene_type:complete
MTSAEKECLLRLEQKLDFVSKNVESNSKEMISIKKEVSELKATVNMGKGAVKALVWIGSIITVIAGLFKYGDGL